MADPVAASPNRNKIVLKIRVDLGDGNYAMLGVRSGPSPMTQALAFMDEHRKDSSLAAPLALRIQAALIGHHQQHTSNSHRLLRDGIDVAQDVPELSYREFPVRLAESDDDDESESDGDSCSNGKDDMEPVQTKGSRRQQSDVSDDIGDGLVVHVMIDGDGRAGQREATLKVAMGDDPIAKVDAFAAQHRLSASKREMLMEHVGTHMPSPSPIVSQSMCLVATVNLNDRFLGRLQMASLDDVVERINEFVGRNGLSSAQRRRLVAALFVNMERIESAPKSGIQSPAMIVIDVDGQSDHSYIDNLLCEDDIMSMLSRDKVAAFCDRRRLSETSEQRRALIKEIEASRSPLPVQKVQASEQTDTGEFVDDNGIGELCLSIKVELDQKTRAAEMFNLIRGDDLVARIAEFSSRHYLNATMQARLMYHVMHNIEKLDSIRKLNKVPIFTIALHHQNGAGSLDSDAILRWAETNAIVYATKEPEESKQNLLDAISRIETGTDSDTMESAPIDIVSIASTPRISGISQSPARERPIRSPLPNSGRVSAHIPKHHTNIEQRPPTNHSRNLSSATAASDRLYKEGLEVMNRKKARASTVFESSEEHDLTFRPTLTQRSLKKSRSNLFLSGRTSTRTQQRQLQYLLDRNQQEIASCTFRPDVHSNYEPSGPVHDRLYRDSEARQERLQAAAAAAAAASAEAISTRSEGDPERLEHIHNYNLYKQQAIDSFRTTFNDVDEDGHPLFQISKYMSNPAPRMKPSEVGAYLHGLGTKASSPVPLVQEPIPTVVDSRSDGIVRKAIGTRLRRIFSAIAHDGLLDGSSTIRVIVDETAIPDRLRSLVKDLVAEGTKNGKTLNFQQFSKGLLRRYHCSGLLPSAIIGIQDRTSAKTKPTRIKKKLQKPSSGRDVFSDLFEQSYELRDRRAMLRYKSFTLETAQLMSNEKADQHPTLERRRYDKTSR